MVFGRRKVRVQTDEGVQTASMVEGAGVFICHKHEFITEDKAKFDAHCTEEGHYLAAGSHGKCVMCNKKGVSMEGLRPGQNAVCDECQLKLVDQISSTKKRLAEMKKR